MQFGKLYRDKQGALVAVPNSDQGEKLVDLLGLSQPLFHGRAVPAVLMQALLVQFGGVLHLPCGSTRVMGASSSSRPVPL